MEDKFILTTLTPPSLRKNPANTSVKAPSGHRTSHSHGHSSSSSSSPNNYAKKKQRSHSSTRYAEVDKPPRKYLGPASSSLLSIPNAVKLSMLNSGFISINKFSRECLFVCPKS